MNPADSNFVECVEPRERTWDRVLLIPAVLLTILIGILYRGVLVGMVEDWIKDPNFSHGFLVVPFSALVVWQGRKKLAKLRLEPSWFGLAVVALSLAMLILGVLGVEYFLQRSSLVFLMAGLVIFFLGGGTFRAVLFLLVFLFFFIPLPTIVFNIITILISTSTAGQVASL